jgi:hypothetical protein
MLTTRFELRFNMIFKTSFAIVFLAVTLSSGIAYAEPPKPSCKFSRALCGYVDDAGKVVIPPQFDAVDKFVEALARRTCPVRRRRI